VLTATGTERFVSVLSPSWPKELEPQDATVPSEQSARLWAKPTATATTLLPASAETPAAALANTGTKRCVVVLSPSWPESL